MIDIRHKQFMGNLGESLDDIAYQAANLSETAGLTPSERAFFRLLDRRIQVLNEEVQYSWGRMTKEEKHE